MIVAAGRINRSHVIGGGGIEDRLSAEGGTRVRREEVKTAGVTKGAVLEVPGDAWGDDAGDLQVIDGDVAPAAGLGVNDAEEDACAGEGGDVPGVVGKGGGLEQRMEAIEEGVAGGVDQVDVNAQTSGALAGAIEVDGGRRAEGERVRGERAAGAVTNLGDGGVGVHGVVGTQVVLAAALGIGRVGLGVGHRLGGEGRAGGGGEFVAVRRVVQVVAFEGPDDRAVDRIGIVPDADVVDDDVAPTAGLAVDDS